MAQLALGLDCATPYLTLALSTEQGEVKQYCERLERDHARHIMPALTDLLKEVGVSPHAVVAVGVGIGPGSYTGVRIGVATAKGIAQALNIPLVGISTLAATAYREAHPHAVVALDARRGNVYTGVYRVADGHVTCEQADAKVSREVMAERYPSLPWVEDQAPDAGYIAHYALKNRRHAKENILPVYL